MEKDVIKLISGKELKAIKVSPRDSFGPYTTRPYIAIDLRGVTLKPWLAGLPCPVIGVGDGTNATYCDVILDSTKSLRLLDQNIRKSPLAAMVFVQQLRASENLSLPDALIAESFAYAAIQNGPEFQDWLKNYKRPVSTHPDSPPLNIEITDNELSITMARPNTQNAIGVMMRDALCEALDMAIIDECITKITLTGAGRTFSIGGDINEFGLVSDPATAHWVRSLRLPAWRMAQLTDRLHIHVNGAAIGAGAEIAAFGKHVTASSKAWFQLPELKYGLIPGAGGTASLPRRIGRHRTAYMGLSMTRIRAQEALNWGLIDAIED